MGRCIFCQIVEGKSPCYKIYEDGLFLGFLDIYPRTVGHSLLIPKKHYRWVYELPEFEKYWQTVLKITKAMQKTLNPTFITYVTHGLEVAHAHVHILPRQHETEFVPPKIFLPKEEMEKVAKIIFQAINSGV
jgi:histidine triad (HIT) family protein